MPLPGRLIIIMMSESEFAGIVTVGEGANWVHVVSSCAHGDSDTVRVTERGHDGSGTEGRSSNLPTRSESVAFVGPSLRSQ